MNTSTKTIAILAPAFLSIALLLSSPAQARRRSSRSRPSPARTQRQDRDRDSGLTLSIDLGTIFNNHTPNRQWVPGHYEIRTEQVLVEPGHYEWQLQSVLVEPGHYEIVIVRPASREARNSRAPITPVRTQKVWVPDRYEMRKIRIYVPDRYETRQVRVWVPGYWVSQPVSQPARTRLNLGAIFNFKF